MDSFGMEENMCWADMVEAEEQQTKPPPHHRPPMPPQDEDDGWKPVRKVTRRGVVASKPIPIVRPKEQTARRVVKHRFHPRE